MKKCSAKKYFLLVILTVMVLFNVLLFLLTKKENHNSSFWTAYGFVMFGFLTLLLSSLFAKQGRTGLAFIHPIVTIAGIYLLIIFLMSLFVFFIPNMALKTVLVMMILVTGIGIIAYTFALMNRELVKRESSPKSQMFKITDVGTVLTSIKNQASDAVLKQQLEELIKTANNAPSLDNDEIIALDKRIFEYVQFVEKNVKRNEMNNVYQNINKLKELFKLRDKKIN